MPKLLTPQRMRLTLRDKQILHIALPSIVSNITVPLLSLVDVAIVGHLGSSSYIGAIAVGGTLFNVIYWLFAFLRMGTSGMTSQSLGRRDLSETMRLFTRSLMISIGVAAVLLIVHPLIRDIALGIINPSDEVREPAALYFNICIWGAPATLGLYAITGWFLGMQNSKAPMAVALTQNIVNIIASLALVYALGMKVEGVALGTVVAQYSGLAAALVLWMKGYGRLRHYVPYTLADCLLGKAAGVWRRDSVTSFFKVNTDIFLRTLCLVFVHFFFIFAGARQGDTALAVNTLLMQLFTLYSYIMDGFAFAGEAIAGKMIGAQNRGGYSDTVRRLFLWGAVMAALFTAVYAAGGEPFLSLLTDNGEVIAQSRVYRPWTLLFPLCGMAAFIWDGIFIGATASRQMLATMLVSAAVFFTVYTVSSPHMGNHGLWLAFVTYLLSRGIVETALSGGVRRRAFGNT